MIIAILSSSLNANLLFEEKMNFLGTTEYNELRTLRILKLICF